MKMPWPYQVAIIVIILAGVGIPLLASYGAYCLITGPRIEQTAADPNYIPDIFDIQQMLLDKGYDLGPKGVDGRLGGPDSYTQKAWDRNSNDQYYKKTIARMEKAK